MKAPSLLSLSMKSAVVNISRINDLTMIPDHILLDLFLRKQQDAKIEVPDAKIREEVEVEKLRIEGINESPKFTLSLSLKSAVINISCIDDLSVIPDHIFLDLFLKIIGAGKLNEKVLKLFMDTKNEDILNYVQLLRIKPIISPILPTRCSEKF